MVDIGVFLRLERKVGLGNPAKKEQLPTRGSCRTSLYAGYGAGIKGNDDVRMAMMKNMMNPTGYGVNPLELMSDKLAVTP